MTTFEFDRRAMLAMGGAFMVSGAHRAMAADGDFSARLAEMQRDGRVSGLHTLLVSRGGKVLFEYYGAGDDQNWGHVDHSRARGPGIPRSSQEALAAHDAQRNVARKRAVAAGERS